MHAVFWPASQFLLYNHDQDEGVFSHGFTIIEWMWTWYRMALHRCTWLARRTASRSLSCYSSTALPSKLPLRFTVSRHLLLSLYSISVLRAGKISVVV